jgi:hypothetical protein
MLNRNPQEISDTTGANIVVSNKDKEHLIRILERHGILKKVMQLNKTEQDSLSNQQYQRE